MVVDHLENAERYYTLHPAFADAFDFLRRHINSTLEPGRHEVDGDRIYMMSVKGGGHGHTDIVVESHQQYIDIHLTLEGLEEIGWLPHSHCADRQTEYDAAGDCELFKDQPISWTALPAGTFAIYFPEDAHAPMVGQGAVRKLVAKVAVN